MIYEYLPDIACLAEFCLARLTRKSLEGEMLGTLMYLKTIVLGIYYTFIFSEKVFQTEKVYLRS